MQYHTKKVPKMHFSYKNVGARVGPHAASEQRLCLSGDEKKICHNKLLFGAENLFLNNNVII